jgi:hypothetical protein
VTIFCRNSARIVAAIMQERDENRSEAAQVGAVDDFCDMRHPVQLLL